MVIEEIKDYTVVTENTKRFPAILASNVAQMERRGVKEIEIQYSTSVVAGIIYHSALIITKE